MDLIDAPEEFRGPALAALAAAGVEDGHLAVQLVDADAIRALNREHRNLDRPTDVLSFPVDEGGPSAGPRELGDVVICPEHTEDLIEAVVHGVLHLCGYDHETRRRRDARAPAPRAGGAVSRSGFVALAGRPNAGKSTLVNQIVGGKVAIVSDKPQTTRREIRGVASGDDWQLVLVDLPGVQRPRDALTERMQRQVERTLADADAALFVLNGEQEIGAGDRFIAEALKTSGVPTVTVLNKVDRLNTPRTVKALSTAAELDVQGELFPISAISGAGVGPVVEQLISLMPEGPFLYPPEETSDQSLELRLAELVREQVLLRTREELPHAVEVEIDEIEERESDGLLVVRARVWAETESQKGILVGAGGRMVRAVGTAARKEIEALLDRRIHLDLNVRVRKGWRRDEGLLDRLGIE